MAQVEVDRLLPRFEAQILNYGTDKTQFDPFEYWCTMWPDLTYSKPGNADIFVFDMSKFNGSYEFYNQDEELDVALDQNITSTITNLNIDMGEIGTLIKDFGGHFGA